jgi:hypothetical protein
MTLASLENRVQALETELAELKKRLEQPPDQEPWWKKISGAFRGDQEFLKAMELGRKWRESARPKQAPSRKKKPKHADS